MDIERLFGAALGSTPSPVGAATMRARTQRPLPRAWTDHLTDPRQMAHPGDGSLSWTGAGRSLSHHAGRARWSAATAGDEALCVRARCRSTTEAHRCDNGRQKREEGQEPRRPPGRHFDPRGHESGLRAPLRGVRRERSHTIGIGCERPRLKFLGPTGAGGGLTAQGSARRWYRRRPLSSAEAQRAARRRRQAPSSTCRRRRRDQLGVAVQTVLAVASIPRRR